MRLKEAGLAREILAVSFGPKATQVGQCLLSSFHSLNQINRNPRMAVSFGPKATHLGWTVSPLPVFTA